MSQNKLNDLFAGRKLIIATKHKKEEVISPIFRETFAVECITHISLDTDVLGTFTGEIEREQGVLETARKKCLMAMKLGKCDMAVASEGSFGAHPALGFVNADDEFLLFMDVKNNLEICVRELSTKTNFRGQEIKSKDELLIFAEEAQFPSHALIIRKKPQDNLDIVKGITDLQLLYDTFELFKNRYGSVYVETDMRAMYNPTRMEVIKAATNKLTQKIKSCCPNCFTPGFGVTKIRAGLPCSLCNFPTRSTLSYEFQCVKCHHKEDKKYPHNKTKEEPTFCDVCNP